MAYTCLIVRGTTNDVLFLRWPRVVAAGALVGFSTVVFVYLATFVLIIADGTLLAEGAVNGRPDVVRSLVGVWGARAFFILAAIFAASRVARGAGERPVLHGLSVGLVAALAQQGLVQLGAPPVELGELVSYLVLGAAGGWMGGVNGRDALMGQEDLRRASGRIAAARSAEEVAAAVGEHLGGPRAVGVVVWSTEPMGPDATRGAEAFASWSPSTAREGAAPERLLRALAPELAGTPWTVLRPGDPGAPEGADWNRAGADLALLVPLVAPGDRRSGTLAVTFRGERRPSRGALGLIATAASQAALALENLRLLEEGRCVGREIGVLNERQRLAHELHDTLAQGFTSIVANLTAAEVARRNGESGYGSALDPGEPYLEKVSGVARESLAEVRRLIWALRPEELERRSLADALGKMAENFARETGIDAGAEVVGERLALRPEAEEALLRTAQEALSNVRKHADAERVRLTLSYMDDAVVLDVADDGRGFDPALLQGREVGAEDRGGFGTTAMRERMERLGGSLLIESTAGEGTIVAAELPVVAEEGGMTPAPAPAAGAAREGS